MGRIISRAIRQIQRNSILISVLWNIIFLMWYTGMLAKIQENGPGLEISLNKNVISSKVEVPMPMPVRKRRRIFRTAPPPAMISGKKVRGKLSLQTQAGDVTVVTAFLNIGNYYKEDEDMTYHPRNFETWMKIFKRIQNPVIAYFDDDKYINMFRAIRNKFQENNTKIIKVNRNKLWAFKLRSKIKNVFRQRLYPKHKPETTNVEYSCYTHSKYDFVERAIDSNPFGSLYYAWLDIGTFRNIAEYRNNQFKIIVPAMFTEEYIGFTVTGELQRKTIRAKDVVQGNLRFVDTQFFIGKSDVLKAWVRRYKHVVDNMIRDGWMSGDEQVIFYMAHPGVGMSTKLHTYRYQGNNPSTMKHVYLAYYASTLDKCERDRSCNGK